MRCEGGEGRRGEWRCRRGWIQAAKQNRGQVQFHKSGILKLDLTPFSRPTNAFAWPEHPAQPQKNPGRAQMPDQGFGYHFIAAGILETRANIQLESRGGEQPLTSPATLTGCKDSLESRPTRRPASSCVALAAFATHSTNNHTRHGQQTESGGFRHSARRANL